MNKIEEIKNKMILTLSKDVSFLKDEIENLQLENAELKEKLSLYGVGKSDLYNQLAEIIKQCSNEVKKEKIGSSEWAWISSKKTLAEYILINYK